MSGTPIGCPKCGSQIKAGTKITGFRTYDVSIEHGGIHKSGGDSPEWELPGLNGECDITGSAGHDLDDCEEDHNFDQQRNNEYLKSLEGLTFTFDPRFDDYETEVDVEGGIVYLQCIDCGWEEEVEENKIAFVNAQSN